MSTTHDIAAMSMVCGDIAEAAHADDIPLEDAIAVRLDLLAHRSEVNAALSAIEARIGRATEGQTVTTGGRRYSYVPATKERYRSEVVVSNAVSHAERACDGDPGKAAWIAAEAVAEAYAQPSRKPTVEALAAIGLTLADVEDPQPGDGMKLDVSEVKGGRR